MGTCKDLENATEGPHFWSVRHVLETGQPTARVQQKMPLVHSFISVLYFGCVATVQCKLSIFLNMYTFFKLYHDKRTMLLYRDLCQLY